MSGTPDKPPPIAHISPASRVWEFHAVAGQPTRTFPVWPPYLERALRRGLLNEELEEFDEASEPDRETCSAREQQRRIAAVARELADIVYVAYGAALHYGVDLDAVIVEVHRANMDKLRVARLRADGKVMKPSEGWRPPDVQRVIFGHPR